MAREPARVPLDSLTTWQPLFTARDEPAAAVR